MSYLPHLRMYTDSSRPVKMPSYKIGIGTQYVHRLKGRDDLLVGSYTTGHYSNGQSGCAFLDGHSDTSPECDVQYASLTSDTSLSTLLNRTNGNFSTNFTEVEFEYRIVTLHDYQPREYQSFIFGLEVYHDKLLYVGDIGGFTERDIEIYGRTRLRLGYKYERPISSTFQAMVNVLFERILDADLRIEANRYEIDLSVYRQMIGLVVGLSSGHDNYNLRFVDAGTQFSIGITWKAFPFFDWG